MIFSPSDCKPLWAFEEITPRSYKIKSAEQLELFVASVVQIFQASDSGSKVQEKMAKVALQWATSCSSRHYAGRSFQVFRALKVPFSWSMLSDVLSRLVESVGDGSEDVQVCLVHPYSVQCCSLNYCCWVYCVFKLLPAKTGLVAKYFS